MLNADSICMINLQNLQLDTQNDKLNNFKSDTKKVATIIEEYEKNIFFTKIDTEETTSKFQPEIDYIEQEHFETIETFISFSNFPGFAKIQNNFIEDINIFTELCLFYLLDKTKEHFNNEMLVLKNKIQSTIFYKHHGDSILILFRDIRAKVSVINQILDQIKFEQTEAELNCIINFYQTQNLIHASVDQNMGSCLSGVCTRISLLEEALLARIESSCRLISQAKSELCGILAKDFDIQLINRGEISEFAGMQIHLFNALKNSVAEQIAINEVIDPHIIDVNLTIENIDEFITDTKIKMLPINISIYLATKLYQLFYNVIDAYNCTDLLTDKISHKNKIPDGFLARVELLITYFNDLYRNNENKIQIGDIVTHVYDENNHEFFKINNLEVKLHYYITRALLPKNTYRILADITDNSFGS